jgi:hypothetical protein
VISARVGKTGEVPGFAEDRSLVEIPEYDTQVQLYPHDTALPGIQIATSRDWIGEKLAAVTGQPPDSFSTELVSYKSWLRCVVMYSAGGRQFYGKVFQDDRGQELSRRLLTFERMLRSSGAPWVTPETVLYDPYARVLVQSELGGRSLSALLKGARRSPSQRDQLLYWVRRAAEGLTAIQELRVEGLETFDAGQTVSALRRDLRRIEVAAPEASSSLEGAVDDLERQAMSQHVEQLVPAHSAFRYSHIFVSESGMSLLDLDNLRLAGANADAGYFLAYLLHTASKRPRLAPLLDEVYDAFLQTWREQPHFDADWLRFHLRAVLLKWAVRRFYSLEPDWRRTMAWTRESVSGGLPGLEA